jgi:hypothetical protein
MKQILLKIAAIREKQKHQGIARTIDRMLESVDNLVKKLPKMSDKM